MFPDPKLEAEALEKRKKEFDAVPSFDIGKTYTMMQSLSKLNKSDEAKETASNDID